MKSPTSFIERKHPFIIYSLLFFSIIFLLFYAIKETNAQIIPGFKESDVSLEILPQNPGPKQTVYLTIDSFAANLNAATITWSVNGKNMLTGKGKKQFSFVSGAIGQQTTVNVKIVAYEGTVEKNIVIVPSSVDIIWEANTYTPPFFKGRPLFSPESSITYIAVPHILQRNNEIPATNLIYTWSNNGTILGENSGYGKNTLTSNGSILPRPMDIGVEVLDPLTGAMAYGQTTVQAEQPFVLFYKNDPLYGIQYEKVLQGNVALSGSEIQISAVPYYFSTRSRDAGVLTYTWKINGVPIEDGLNLSNKIFRKIEGSVGNSNISISVNKQDTIFQVADQDFMINFK